MRDTLPSFRFETHMAVGVAANELGPDRPTWTRRTRFVRGLMRTNHCVLFIPTQSVPKANFRFDGSPPVLIVRTTRFVRGLIFETVPSRSFDDQIQPPPAAMSH